MSARAGRVSGMQEYISELSKYITELSKYIIPALMAVYVLCGYACLWDRLGRKASVYVFRSVLIFLLQLVLFADLALVSRELEYVFFYAFVQMFLLAAAVMVPVIYRQADRLLLNSMCMLLGTGLCIVSRLSFNKAVRQYIIALVSFAASLCIPWVLSRIRFLRKLTWVYGLLGIGLLGAVLIRSEITYGAEISFTIGGVTFQPSEFVKLIFVFFLAGALWEDASFPRIALTAAAAGAHVVILVLSKDLGSALIFFVSYVFIVFVAARNYLYLLAGMLGGGGAAWGAYELFAHVRNRVVTWRDPWTYIDRAGYSVTQSLFAIGGGSWFGMGLLQGDPTAIPFVEKDFIFSSLCEELGAVFGICVLLLALLCFLAMMRTAARIRDRFYQLIVYGIGIMYIFQIFLTVGGGVKLIPLTGVTLPFISYGGSSVTVTMAMFFIIQGIYIRLQQEGGGQSVGKIGEQQGGQEAEQEDPEAEGD